MEKNTWYLKYTRNIISKYFKKINKCLRIISSRGNIPLQYYFMLKIGRNLAFLMLKKWLKTLKEFKKKESKTILYSLKDFYFNTLILKKLNTYTLVPKRFSF